MVVMRYSGRGRYSDRSQDAFSFFRKGVRTQSRRSRPRGTPAALPQHLRSHCIHADGSCPSLPRLCRQLLSAHDAVSCSSYHRSVPRSGSSLPSASTLTHDCILPPARSTRRRLRYRPRSNTRLPLPILQRAHRGPQSTLHHRVPVCVRVRPRLVPQNGRDEPRSFGRGI